MVFFWTMKSAEQGWYQEQYDIASLYEKGEGVEQDYEKALYWYQKAAEED